jgi:hypothetical protein
MKIEVNDIIRELKCEYVSLSREYEDECARDYMSRSATYMDGKLAMLYKVIEILEDANDDAIVNELVDSCFEDEEDYDFEDDVDESNYDPYMGCDCFDN